MRTRLQAQVKTTLVQTPSFTPVRSGLLQCRSMNRAEPATVPPIVHDVLRSPDRALDSKTRTVIASHFCHDSGRLPVRTTAPVTIEPKLIIGQPRDKYEQEADRVADTVVHMPEPQVQRQEEEPEEEEEETIQTKRPRGQTPQADPSIVSKIRSLRGDGQPLPTSARDFFEPRFGHDFSQVRVHTNGQAAEVAQAVKARAFTLGRDIAFGAGQYVPGTSAGARLLAHELTHVVQQQGGHENLPRRGFAHNFVQLSPSSDEKEWGGFRIIGEPDYIKGVKEDLEKINRVPIGAELIAVMSEYGIRIGDYEVNCFDCTDTYEISYTRKNTLKRDCERKLKQICGEYSEGEYEGWSSVNPFVLLFHELVHAYLTYREGYGAQQLGVECLVIGLGDYFNRQRFSENKFRRELGLPPRPCNTFCTPLLVEKGLGEQGVSVCPPTSWVRRLSGQETYPPVTWARDRAERTMVAIPKAGVNLEQVAYFLYGDVAAETELAAKNKLGPSTPLVPGRPLRLTGKKLTEAAYHHYQQFLGVPLSAQDATQMSITEEWARSLDNVELVEQTGHVREQLLTLDPRTPEHEALRLNLQVLEAELARRPRAIGELAVSPLPTATVILVGSPTNYQTQAYDRHPYNYTDAAVKAVPKIQAVLPGTHATILYFSPGYKLRGKKVHEKALKHLRATGTTVVEVTAADEVIRFLNTGLISPDETVPTRAVRVSRFFYFGHGEADKMLLNWGWGRDYHTLSKEDVINIKKEAFEPKGESYLFTCHIAEGQHSFMSTWASHLGQTSIGPQGNAAFNAKYDASDLENALNKELPKWFLGLPYMNKVKIIDPESEARE